MPMKKIFTITFFICVAVFFYNFFLENNEIQEDSLSIVYEQEDAQDEIKDLDTAGDDEGASLNEKKETLRKGQDRAEVLSEMKNKQPLKNSNPEQIQLNTREIIEAESPMARGAAKSYKEVTTLDLKGENAFKLTLDQSLDKVGSVVLVSLDGSFLIHNFSANKKSNKTFKKGQETMKGDWVKLDNIQGDLKTIELETYSELNNRVRVYVQYFSEDGDL